MLLIATLLIAPASAWEVMTVPGTDTEVAWYDTPIRYDIADDPTLDGSSVDAIRDAFDSWSGVRGAQVGFEGGRTVRRAGLADLDDAHLVYVDHDWPYDDDVLALAATWADDTSGEVLHFDLRLNGHLSWGTDGEPDRYDLGSAVRHEVGHVLGLDHTAVRDAVMFAELDPGTVHAGLHPDDEDGLRYLYAPEDAVPFACTTAGTSTTGWLLPPLLLLVRKRR